MNKMSNWESVTILPKSPQKVNLRSRAAVNAARRQGKPIEIKHKFGAGTNPQHVISKNPAKLDRETVELRHKKIPAQVSKLIIQARQAKCLSQKDLATKICEKQQVITDYEASRCIPNNMILGKIEKVLGIKLRGKDLGQPITLGPAKHENRPHSI